MIKVQNFNRCGLICEPKATLFYEEFIGKWQHLEIKDNKKLREIAWFSEAHENTYKSDPEITAVENFKAKAHLGL